MPVGYLEYWYQALSSDIGIEIQTDNPERLRQRLYQERTKAIDPDLEGLSIIISPIDNSKIWIVKKHAPKKV